MFRPFAKELTFSSNVKSRGNKQLNYNNKYINYKRVRKIEEWILYGARQYLVSFYYQMRFKCKVTCYNILSYFEFIFFNDVIIYTFDPSDIHG